MAATGTAGGERLLAPLAAAAREEMVLVEVLGRFWICTYGGCAEIGFIYLIVRILGTFNLKSGGSTSTPGFCGSELVKV